MRGSICLGTPIHSPDINSEALGSGNLHVEVLDDEIIVTLPYTHYYYKPSNSPQLLAKRFSGKDDPHARLTRANFLAQLAHRLLQHLVDLARFCFIELLGSLEPLGPVCEVVVGGGNGRRRLLSEADMRMFERSRRD